jgi:ubiquinone/menaquinone biosynthesis C-methylase UbiE
MPLVTSDSQRVAGDFDVRAANYARNRWHRVYAEALIAHSAIRSEDRVLDAGVGTGFAAIAAATRVGSNGEVVGVDLSSGMLHQARIAIEAAQLPNVELCQADASDLREMPSGSFDAVVCAAALLYMPVQRALTEWSRLLRPGGTIGFSTMCKGSPQAGQLFRDCAAEFGVRLEDPSAALGSESAASAALRTAAFVEIRVVAGRVLLSDADLSCAWESNLRSAAQADIRSLAPTRLEALRTRFEQALTERRQSVPSFAAADVLYAYGRKRAGGDA